MELYRKAAHMQTRWSSFENPMAAKGAGAQTNKGWKGSAFRRIEPGETLTLLEIDGCGIIHRIWLTISDRSPLMLRSLRIEMYWDGAQTPAVSVPLGDFFCCGNGKIVPFENELFSSPEGRSLNCFVPMPFYTNARITITNESSLPLTHFFYDINFSLTEPAAQSDFLYFHAYWNRENPTVLGEDYRILPRLKGNGRFLGTSLGIFANPDYPDSWWGEGEVKIYLDGDRDFPTLVGTGTEDYIGTGWGQGTFCHRYQGCLQNDPDTGGISFYRFHIPDPLYFQEECMVTIQQIGGTQKKTLLRYKEKGVPFTVISADRNGTLIRMLEEAGKISWEDEQFDENLFMNFMRRDDVSAAAYFYLDSPENGLPPLPDVQQRVAGLEPR